ncbi:SSI family serine proteinase inhibitor [Streptomyces sp. NPDC087300]|uniref:SSI family serine proteinase inhibitor n=1 Tax=Streptomyces sp. NPDC087300 TaxID=3365780 RepID=UPI00382F6CFC
MARTVRNGLLTTAAATAAGALLASGATTATARATPDRAPRGDWMYVTVMQGDGVLGDSVGRLLNCGKDDVNSHPEADKACHQLRKAGGDVNKVPHRSALCTMIYKPVTASAYGMWNGRRTAYVKNFPNACVMAAETGSVFKVG